MRVGSTVSTIRGECFRRGQALELMISTRSPRVTASMERYCGVLTVSYRGRLLRRCAAQSARALNVWPTTASVQGEYRSSANRRACVLHANRVREESRAGVAGVVSDVSRDTACVSS
jgi:hypothetical protein